MATSTLDIAVAYYTAASEKNLAEMEKYLHPDMQFVGPFAKTSGKGVFLESLKNFLASFQSLKIRSKVGTGDLAVLVYDVEFPAPIGKIPTASLVTLKEDLIIKIELFFDARPFEKR